jgi:chromosome segregation ATPase
VEVEGYGKLGVVLEDATPVYRTADIRSPEGMELVRVYLSQAAIDGPLKGEVEQLLRTQKEIGDAQQHIATLREQMGEYRQRMDELHAQIVTLRAVRTAGPLMASLEKKMQDVSDKLSKATIDVVAVEETLMLARIKFQDRVADLSLEPAPKDKDGVASK